MGESGGGFLIKYNKKNVFFERGGVENGEWRVEIGEKSIGKLVNWSIGKLVNL